MLGPEERTSLLEILTPPTGYVLDVGVGTSYSLDLTVLTSILLTFTNAGEGLEESHIHPVEWFHAFQKHTDRLAIFCNRGNISLPSVSSRLMTLYDAFIHDVRWQGGVFHPKVWVLRYITKGETGSEPVYRLVCSSRNLTKPNNWEILVSIDGARLPRGGRNESVTRFLRQITKNSDITGAKKRRISELINELDRVEFDAPHGFEDFQFRFQTSPDGMHGELPERGNDALIVSPFLDSTFVSRFSKRFQRPYILSTQTALDGISEKAYLQLDKERIFVVKDPLYDGVDDEMGLHAKLYIVNTDSKTTILAGSANATSKGWFGGNCEAIVKLKSDRYEVKQFLKEFVYEGMQRGWVDPYKREKITDDPQQRVEDELNALQTVLSQLEIELEYAQEEEKLVLRIHPLATSFRFSNDFTITCGVLGIDQEFPITQKSIGQGVSFTYNNVSLSTITSFVMFKMKSRSFGNEKKFMVMAITNFKDRIKDRVQVFLSDLVSSRGNLSLLLRYILFDSSPYDLGSTSAAEEQNQGDQTTARSYSGLDSISLEDVLKACHRQPTKIDEIDGVISLLKEGVDDYRDFVMFWGKFKAAYAAFEDKTAS